MVFKYSCELTISEWKYNQGAYDIAIEGFFSMIIGTINYKILKKHDCSENIQTLLKTCNAVK